MLNEKNTVVNVPANAPEFIPYIAHESEVGRLQRIIEKLLGVVILLVVLLVGTNIAWVWYESRFVDEVTETIETSADGGGNAYGTIVSGNKSEVHYGEGEDNAN